MRLKKIGMIWIRGVSRWRDRLGAEVVMDVCARDEGEGAVIEHELSVVGSLSGSLDL